jgi:exodeoxyribonuclease VII large subunit
MIEYSVDQLVSEMAEAVDRHLDEVVTVRGELTKWTVAASGHGYGELRGQGSFIHLVALRWEFGPRVAEISPGTEVVVAGRPCVHGPRAQLQLRVREVVASAKGGSREVERDRVLSCLAREGLLCSTRKRPIPSMPSRIGLVTSLNGSAIEDVVQVLRTRAPWTSLLHAHALVQGGAAPASIVSAVEALGADPSVEVILLTRGGGDRRSLEAFDSEFVARAVVRSPVPVVSAVGHADDLSIADLVTDASAITPTDAAHLVAPGVDTVRQALLRAAKGLDCMAARVHRVRSRLESLRESKKGHLGAKMDRGELMRERFGAESLDAALRHGVRLRQARLGALETSMTGALQSKIETGSATLTRPGPNPLHGQLRSVLTRHVVGCRGTRARIEGLSPLRILARGYSVAYGPDGRAIRAPDEVTAGDSLVLRVRDGLVPVTVSLESGGTL